MQWTRGWRAASRSSDCPRVVARRGDVRLGAVVDDHVEIRVAIEQREQRRQLRRLHQRVEAQAERRQRLDCGATSARRIHCGSGEILQHRTDRLQQRIGRELAERVDGVRRGEIDPADDAAHRALAGLRDLSRKRVSATVGAACTSTAARDACRRGER